MAIKNILFDLDGTLLPMDQDIFVEKYTKGLAKHMMPYGYDPQLLIKGLWKGTGAMIKNDGSRTNEEVFWEVFSAVLGRDARADIDTIEQFYLTDFQNVKNDCGFNASSAEIINMLKSNGFNLILATNPLFPSIATYSRVRWAGLAPEDFSFITTYENASFCKPNPEYYAELLAKTGCKPEESVMVGNDVDDDMAVEALGMKSFLLTDCLINKSDTDISRWPHGSFDGLERWLNQLN